MPKLYYSPGAGSLACHIAIEETGLPVELIFSKWGDENTWSRIRAINPQGAIPTLEFEDGRYLSQVIGILTWIVEQAPKSNLLPAAGTFERAKVYQWLSWGVSDLYSEFGPLFSDQTSEAVQKQAVSEIARMFGQAESILKKQDYIVGSSLTVADIYLWVAFSWCGWAEIPTDPFPALQAYTDRLKKRPSFQKALAREANEGRNA
jgi:glutathione S-transferase